MPTQDTLDAPVEQLSWTEVLADYERESAAYAISRAEYERACDEYEASYPDRDAEFARYGLTFHQVGYSRNQAMLRAEVSIAQRKFTGRKEELTAEEIAAVREEATRVADDFLTWTTARHAAYVALDPIEDQHDTVINRLWEAQQRLLSTAAPDTDALLRKLDILAEIMVGSREQDAPHVSLIRDDAHRLLGADA